MMNRSDDTTKSPIQYPLVIGFVLHSAVLQWPSGSSPTRLSIRDHDLNGTSLFPSSPAYNFTLDSGCKITGPTHAERSVFAYCVTCVKPLSTHTHLCIDRSGSHKIHNRFHSPSLALLWWCIWCVCRKAQTRPGMTWFGFQSEALELSLGWMKRETWSILTRRASGRRKNPFSSEK